MWPDPCHPGAFLLAAGEIDLQTVIYLAVFAAISVLGTLFKKKKPEEQAGRGRTPTQPPPRPLPRRPVPPGGPVPRPPVSARPVPPPVPPWQRPPVRRPAPVMPVRVSPPEPEPIVVEVVEAGPPPVAAAPLPLPTPPVSPILSRVEEMLRDRTQLQTAFVLGEILGTPLALREDDLQR